MAFGHLDEEHPISDLEANFEVAKASIRQHITTLITQADSELRDFTIAVGRSNQGSSLILEIRLFGVPENIAHNLPDRFMGFGVNYESMSVVTFQEELDLR